jgi:hypothetical protein
MLRQRFSALALRINSLDSALFLNGAESELSMRSAVGCGMSFGLSGCGYPYQGGRMRVSSMHPATGPKSA